MEQELIKTLKQIKEVKPDEGFIERSRNLILTATKPARPGFNLFDNLKLAAVLTMASVLLFVAITGLPYLKGAGPGPVAKEGVPQSGDFYIQLGEVKYDLNQDKELGAEIEKILKEKHL